MKKAPKSWKIRDRDRLLRAVMGELGGDANISFEGDLHKTGLARISGASAEETSALKRNKIWPRQEFVVLSLDSSAVPEILVAIGGTVPRDIIHIQIAKAGKLEFGAYDNFHPHAIYFGPALSQTFVDSLIAEGILGPAEKEKP